MSEGFNQPASVTRELSLILIQSRLCPQHWPFT